MVADTKPRTAAQLAADDKRRLKAVEKADAKEAATAEKRAVDAAEADAETRGVDTIKVVALKTWNCNFIKRNYALTKGEAYTIPMDLYKALTNPLLPGPVVRAD